MTIDDLARSTGLVASTVRLYQNKGLLPPPTKRGRVGYYGPTHRGRLRLIAQLQARGFSLAGIRELLDGMDKGDSLRTLLGLGDVPSTWTTEEPQTMPLEELASNLPSMEFNDDLVRRVMDLGLVEFSDDGSHAVLTKPSFLDIGSDIAALGVPPEVILDEYENLRTETDAIAGRFTEVFRTHLWESFVKSGMPADQVRPLIGALEKLGSLAEAVVVMCLRQSLQDAAERFVEEEARRLDLDIPRPGQED